MAKSANQYFYANGKRKTSVAKVYLTPAAKGGKFEVNGKDLSAYFSGNAVGNAKSALVLTETLEKFDVKVIVSGGGLSSQSDAVRHGTAKALQLFNPSFRLALKASGYLTRDPRRKERKKFGLKKARKSPQWSKR
jgi:small subunit ribosomal protein S9